MEKVKFKQMKDGTKEEYLLLDKHEKKYIEGTADRIINFMSGLSNTLEGYQVTRLEHSLQTATRALNDKANEEMIVAALLHDIGDELAPLNHSEYAASVLKPYVSEKTHCIIEKHGEFQMYYYAHHLNGNRNQRDKYKGHKYYQDTLNFCENWDQKSFDPNFKSLTLKDLEPFVTWGTNPGMVIPVTSKIPNPNNAFNEIEKESWERALSYMDLKPDIPITDVAIDRVFIGSCTNSRIEDIRAAATVVKGKKVNDQVYAMVVPGSVSVKEQAENEGLDRILIESGFDWREAGCSMCLGMNPDILQPKERCASTSNRNFEGRQGKGGRTHLVSPQMAAAAAIEGRFVDIRDW